jgi:predicted GNAT family acetyltransferase
MATDTHILCTYTSATDFLAVMQPRLAAHEALYGLMLGIALRLQAYPERIEQPPYLATVLDGADACTAALMTPPHGLVLYSDQRDPAEALDQLADNLHTHGWTMPTVNGLTHLTAVFAPIWAQRQGIGYVIDSEQRAFELRKVEPPMYSAGAMRLATGTDLDLVAQWFAAFEQEALHEQEIDPVVNRQRAQMRITDQTIYLWEDGEPVALAGITRPTPQGMGVGPVYTPPEQRGHGYATSLVAQVSQQLLASGRQFCTLFTDLANPTSNSIYQKIGYRPVGDYTVYRFGKG